MRRAFRRAILAVTPKQVMQAAETYLNQEMSMAVVTSKENECSLPSEFARLALKANGVRYGGQNVLASCRLNGRPYPFL